MTDGRPCELVKPPQTRGGRGRSEVYLEPGERWGLAGGHVYVKRQEKYFCRPIWRFFRRTPTLRRELRALEACHRLSIPVPDVIRYEERGGKAQLVTAEVADSQPLGEALAADGDTRRMILRRVARALARLHRSGWYHGALYPDHILVGRTHPRTVTLIDLEKARRNRHRRDEDLQRLLRYLEPGLTNGERGEFQYAYQNALQGPDS